MSPVLFLDVLLDEKLGKKCKHEDHHGCSYKAELPGVSTLDISQNDWQAFDKDTDELYHLKRCQILFPPQIFLNAGSKSSQEIIGIHDDMYQGIEHNSK